MSYRTTEAAVKKLLDGFDPDADFDPFLEVANDLVTENCLASDYSDARLERIERWLAAHFYAVRDPRARSEGAGPVNASYEGSSGMGLDFTRYGQMVKMVDSAGNLAALDAMAKDGKVPKRATLRWLGTKDC